VIGGFFIGLVVGAALVMAAVHFLVLPNQAKLYLRITELMERDRQEAKAEAKIFRSLVLPGLAKLESTNSGAPGISTALSVPRPDSGAKTADPSASLPPKSSLFNRRIPFRIRFKDAVKANNDPQKRTDALAQALIQQKVPKPEEKQNVEV
jgi:hypothetical protein